MGDKLGLAGEGEEAVILCRICKPFMRKQPCPRREDQRDIWPLTGPLSSRAGLA